MHRCHTNTHMHSSTQTVLTLIHMPGGMSNFSSSQTLRTLMVPNRPAGRARDHMINQTLFQNLNYILKIVALKDNEPEDLN